MTLINLNFPSENFSMWVLSTSTPFWMEIKGWSQIL
jgi:hypothetical protein